MAQEQLELALGRRAHVGRLVKGLLDCPGAADRPLRRGAPEGLRLNRIRRPLATTYDLVAAYGAIIARTEYLHA